MSILDVARSALQPGDYVLQEFGDRVKAGEYIAIYWPDGRRKLQIDRSTMDNLAREKRLQYRPGPEIDLCRLDAL